MRRRIKAMSYGLAYGLSAFGLSGQLKISVDEAKEQMEAYFARFGGIRDYLRHSVDVARREGYTADAARPPPVPAGPGAATTGSDGRWPSGWR